MRVSPISYSDGAYEMAGDDKPNPLDISLKAHRKMQDKSSRFSRNVLQAVYAQLVLDEMAQFHMTTCPPEYENLDLPDDHPLRNYTTRPLVYLRSLYDQSTGYTSTGPRQQVNLVSSFLDGGIIYGTTHVWTNLLRSFSGGELLADSDEVKKSFPLRNDVKLPYYNAPIPRDHELKPVNRLFRIGNAKGHENPFLLALQVVWFRWHNWVAKEIAARSNQSDDEIFELARRKVIATFQILNGVSWDVKTAISWDVKTAVSWDVKTAVSWDVKTAVSWDVKTAVSWDVKTAVSWDVKTAVSWDVKTAVSWDVKTAVSWDVKTAVSWDINTAVSWDVKTAVSWDVKTAISWDVKTTVSWDVKPLVSWDINTAVSWDVKTAVSWDVKTAVSWDVKTTVSWDVKTAVSWDVKTAVSWDKIAVKEWLPSFMNGNMSDNSTKLFPDYTKYNSRTQPGITQEFLAAMEFRNSILPSAVWMLGHTFAENVYQSQAVSNLKIRNVHIMGSNRKRKLLDIVD
ncbi:hypothetical protein Btru_068670 [Bulinus truncatus]|nr:hypothetical protein Btru_068670 [Bulinus truncatus]